jgi:hypothetical protein
MYKLIVGKGRVINGRMKGPCHIHPNTKRSAWKWKDDGIMLLSKSGSSKKCEGDHEVQFIQGILPLIFNETFRSG